MLRTPVWARRRISSSFVSRSIDFFSFCNPSLGPTSTMRTSPASRGAVVDRQRVDDGGQTARKPRAIPIGFSILIMQSSKGCFRSLRPTVKASYSLWRAF